MPRNDPNKVLRTSSSTTVNARDYTMVLADATAAPITITLITPGSYSEWSIKIKNTGTGDDVTLSIAGGGSFSFVLPKGSGCEVTQDDLGVLHVFGSSGGSSGGEIDGAGTTNTVAVFTSENSIGDSLIINDGTEVRVRMPDTTTQNVTAFSAANQNGNYSVGVNTAYVGEVPTTTTAALFAARFDFTKEASITAIADEVGTGSGAATVTIVADDTITLDTGAINVGSSLPTSDPHVAGQLWSNLGIVTVSAG